MILIFLCLNFSESSSQVYINSELWLLNLESRYQTNWNTSDYNLDLKFGVSYDIFGGGFLFLTKKLDFLQIGYNHNGVDDFLSFNLLKYEKIDSWKECKEKKRKVRKETPKIVVLSVVTTDRTSHKSKVSSICK
jgi:hypothetical protein